MSRWFRHYAGMMRDDKLVRVALKTKQPIERVLWVWGAILESAAEVDTFGKYDFDEAEAAHFLRVKPATIAGIVSALEAAGHIAENAVCKWKSRQFQSDRSKDRVAAHRAKKRSVTVEDTDEGDTGNVDVTLQKRHGNAPETETETYTSVSNDTGTDGADPSKIMFDAGVGLITKSGKSQSAARSWLAKARKDHGTEAVITAISAAKREGAIEPISYMEASLRTRARTAEPAFSGPC